MHGQADFHSGTDPHSNPAALARSGRPVAEGAASTLAAPVAAGPVVAEANPITRGLIAAPAFRDHVAQLRAGLGAAQREAFISAALRGADVGADGWPVDAHAVLTVLRRAGWTLRAIAIETAWPGLAVGWSRVWEVDQIRTRRNGWRYCPIDKAPDELREALDKHGCHSVESPAVHNEGRIAETTRPSQKPVAVEAASGRRGSDGQDRYRR